MADRMLRERMRAATDDGTDQARIVVRSDGNAASAAVIICDMWDAHRIVVMPARRDGRPRVLGVVLQSRTPADTTLYPLPNF